MMVIVILIDSFLFGNGSFQIIQVEESTRHNWVKTYRHDFFYKGNNRLVYHTTSLLFSGKRHVINMI